MKYNYKKLYKLINSVVVILLALTCFESIVIVIVVVVVVDCYHSTGVVIVVTKNENIFLKLFCKYLSLNKEAHGAGIL